MFASYSKLLTRLSEKLRNSNYYRNTRIKPRNEQSKSDSGLQQSYLFSSRDTSDYKRSLVQKRDRNKRFEINWHVYSIRRVWEQLAVCVFNAVLAVVSWDRSMEAELFLLNQLTCCKTLFFCLFFIALWLILQ